jgi:prepilin-type N-terminal cleavage/methylation domain-containing protein/prepilin-type processing-associated H-X9-DG protein
MNRTHVHSRRRGFTLVELLVVIGIIALLISILLPVLNKAKEAANKVKCLSQIKSIMTATLTYCSDNKGSFPPAPGIGQFAVLRNGDGSPQKINGLDAVDQRAPLLMMYMYPTNAILTAQDGSTKAQNQVGGLVDFDHGTLWPYVSKGSNSHEQLFNCPSDSTANRAVANNVSSTNADNPPPPLMYVGSRNFTYSFNYNMNGKKNTQIKEGTHKIIVCEEVAPNDVQAWIGRGTTDDTPSFRHTLRGNYGFADGHADTMGPTDLGYGEIKNMTEFAKQVDRSKVLYYFSL